MGVLWAEPQCSGIGALKRRPPETSFSTTEDTEKTLLASKEEGRQESNCAGTWPQTVRFQNHEKMNVT